MGLAVQLFFGVDLALAVGALVGVVAANFVPGTSACSPKEPVQGASSRDSFTSDRNSSR